MNLDRFNQKRQAIVMCYSTLCSMAKTFNSKHIEDQVQASLESLRQDNFNIVVVGEFSRGKSTFINALLGKKVLPAATKPTTTMINKISYGDENKFVLHFRDGNGSKEVDETEFYKIVAEKEPDYEDDQEMDRYKDRIKWLQSIEYADIKYPIPICKEGVEIIDTPGTNDLDIHREEVTFNFLPKADVALFLLSATQILSKSEMQFLKERIIGNQIKNIFIIINFKDKLNQEQEKEDAVMLYAKEHLKEYLPNPKLFLVSGKQALNFKRHKNGESVKNLQISDLHESGFVELEQKMSDYLINERSNIKLQKHVDRGHILIDEFLNTIIKVRLNAVGLTAIQLENKIKETKPRFEKTKSDARKIIEALRVKLTSLEADLITIYRNDLEKIAVEANSIVNNYMGELDIDLISSSIENKVAPLQKSMQDKIETYKLQAIDVEIEKTNKKIKTIWEDMSCQITGAALVPISSSNGNTLIPIGKEADSNEGENALLLGGLAILAFNIPFIAIPAALFFGEDLFNFFKEKKRQNFISKVKRQVDARYREVIPLQITMFAATYRKNITEVEQTIERQINNRVDDLAQQLDQLLLEKRKEDETVAKEMARLHSYAEELDSLRFKLNGVL